MKLVAFLLIIISANNFVLAKTRNTPELGICKMLSSQVATNPLLEGFNVIPRSWDDFYGVRYVKDGRMDGDPILMRRVNELAFVPEAPVIKVDPRIDHEFIGWGMIAISRQEKFHDAYHSAGRYAIIVGPNPNDTENLRFQSHFLPAETAQAVLEQIPNFDPTSQPVAFENVEHLERAERERDSKTTEFLKKHERDPKIQGVKTALSVGGLGEGKKSAWRLWLALVLPFFALFAWFVFRSKMLKAKGKDR